MPSQAGESSIPGETVRRARPNAAISLTLLRAAKLSTQVADGSVTRALLERAMRFELTTSTLAR